MFQIFLHNVFPCFTGWFIQIRTDEKTKMVQVRDAQRCTNKEKMKSNWLKKKGENLGEKGEARSNE